MRSQPHSWHCILRRFGLTGRKFRRRTKIGYYRPLFFEQCENRRMLTEFTVNSLIDTDVFNDTDSVVTLREAISRANASPGEDTITFSTNPAHGLNSTLR